LVYEVRPERYKDLGLPISRFGLELVSISVLDICNKLAILEDMAASE
jgi:hypothetical protein